MLLAALATVISASTVVALFACLAAGRASRAEEDRYLAYMEGIDTSEAMAAPAPAGD